MPSVVSSVLPPAGDGAAAAASPEGQEASVRVAISSAEVMEGVESKSADFSSVWPVDWSTVVLGLVAAAELASAAGAAAPGG